MNFICKAGGYLDCQFSKMCILLWKLGIDQNLQLWLSSFIGTDGIENTASSWMRVSDMCYSRIYVNV
jgi:hypothetical protein